MHDFLSSVTIIKLTDIFITIDRDHKMLQKLICESSFSKESAAKRIHRQVAAAIGVFAVERSLRDF